MSHTMNDNNKLKIAGKVLSDCSMNHKIYGETFYEFNLEVPRLSGTVDILPVMVSDRLINISEIIVGKYVRIEGQYRSYNMKQYSETKNRQKMIIFVHKINTSEYIIKNLNELSLNGYICKEPDYHQTSLGQDACDIMLAVNRGYNKSDYIPLILWGKNAKLASTFKIGDNIKVKGRIQHRNYKKSIGNQQFEQRTAYEVAVYTTKLLSKKK